MGDDEMTVFQEKSISIRRKIIKTANTQYDAHFGGCLSAVEILVALLCDARFINPDSFQQAVRNRFILSKGHAALALYAALNEFGAISDEELASFHVDGSEFQTHPSKAPFKGIEISSGSLATGFSMSCVGGLCH